MQRDSHPLVFTITDACLGHSTERVWDGGIRGSKHDQMLSPTLSHTNEKADSVKSSRQDGCAMVLESQL